MATVRNNHDSLGFNEMVDLILADRKSTRLNSSH